VVQVTVSGGFVTDRRERVARSNRVDLYTES